MSLLPVIFYFSFCKLHKSFILLYVALFRLWYFISTIDLLHFYFGLTGASIQRYLNFISTTLKLTQFNSNRPVWTLKMIYILFNWPHFHHLNFNSFNPLPLSIANSSRRNVSVLFHIAKIMTDTSIEAKEIRIKIPTQMWHSKNYLKCFNSYLPNMKIKINLKPKRNVGCLLHSRELPHWTTTSGNPGKLCAWQKDNKNIETMAPKRNPNWTMSRKKKTKHKYTYI